MNKRLSIVVGMLILFSAVACQKDVACDGTECVVLVHGLARTERSLRKLENHLKSSGYCVVNVGYPSRTKIIQELSIDIIPAAIKQCASYKASKVHFVTHSMGAILVRYYLAHNDIPKLGRVVMLSPPNKGSEIVDKLRDKRIFRWINGPAGMQMGTEEGSLPNSLGSPNYEVGVITGDESINPFLSLMIPGEDDGKVSIENAKLAGMKDFLIVHQSHTFIMNDEKVIQQVVMFIENGMFAHN